MAGPILRLKDLIVHIGLSRSAIYDRMDKKSPRYAENFPKSFSLGGKAVGWYQDEIDEWLATCATNAKCKALPKKTKLSLKAKNIAVQAAPTPVEWIESLKPLQKSPRQTTSVPGNSAYQSPTKRTSRTRNLAEDIVQGGRINDRLLHYVRLKSWTPAMGALLISGIEPPLGCIDIPVDGVGLDGRPLHGGDERFHKARSILSEWNLWPADASNPSSAIEPSDFLIWCVEKDITSEWFRLILELTGCTDEDAADLNASRFALLTSR